MCLYPKLIENRKYKANKKNGGNIPPVLDDRVKYVPVGCGNCIECRKKKSRDWLIRLTEDIKTHKNGLFITLTYSNDSIKHLTEDVNSNVLYGSKRIKCTRNLEGYTLDNEIAKRSLRLFNERWRKKYKKALRHWFITELGHNGTENIHMHGIVWVDIKNKLEAYTELEKIWNYGHIWPNSKSTRLATFVNNSTVTYMVKYISKTDLDHKTYKPIVLCSPGIGKGYIRSVSFKDNKFKGANTNESYRTNNGYKIQLPIYYRNHIYNDEEKEKLWLNKLDLNVRYVCGEKIKADDHKSYNSLLDFYRRLNKQLGYGTDEKNYNQMEYEHQKRILLQKTRIAKAQK